MVARSIMRSSRDRKAYKNVGSAKLSCLLHALLNAMNEITKAMLKVNSVYLCKVASPDWLERGTPTYCPRGMQMSSSLDLNLVKH